MTNDKHLNLMTPGSNYEIQLASLLEQEFIFRRLKNLTAVNKKLSYQNYLIHKIFSLYRKKNWLHTASTKTKSEVRGGGKKPWPQKGRGRARVGSIRSPLWRGGGVCFGPKPKILSLKINNKEYDKALKNLLFLKQNQIIPVGFNKAKSYYAKTKFASINLNDVCQQFKKENFLSSTSKTKLFIISELEFNLIMQSSYLTSIKNIPNVSLCKVDDLRFDKVIKADKILLTSFAINELTNKDLVWKK